MPYPDEAVGFMADGPESFGTFTKRAYKLKPFEEFDIDVKVEACGICGSDVHTVSGGWGEQLFPLCCGHEIVGTAVRVGPKVTTIKEGQRVGIGAQAYSCGECKQCRNGNENYCPVNSINTYGSKWPDTGIVSQGGYGSHVRAHEHWVFPIPEALETTNVAPMLCAGLTAFSRWYATVPGRGRRLALGAETWAISRSRAKEADAKKLGADGYIATAEEGWEKPHLTSFDLIVNCANSSKGFDLPRYLSMMDVHGRWISVGLPEEEGQVIKAQNLISNGVLIGATHIGNRQEMLAMLKLAAEKGLRSYVEEIQIGEEGLKQAMQRMKKGDVRYRFILTGYDKHFARDLKI
ncbi:hypothetical protein N7468_004559 [Penicillium chermesinum]|uniref:Uncharacterized protein n=1 Tax=Penicillium chermesinum TaxID=63820 RepID=A0A9W9P900_9EURO|nr:uncharacterized protein N7468_004559 [Penicillium chermesinum]KAJ5239940.1 hypothetical protein N7468_004559 [Penicillium chermesinum]